MAGMVDWGAVLSNNEVDPGLVQASQQPMVTRNQQPYQAPQNPIAENFNATNNPAQTIPWFTQNPNAPADPEADNKILGELWDWAKSDTGSGIIAGIGSEIYSEYKRGKQQELSDERWEREMALAEAMAAKPTAAELQDARIAAHNKSINKPMDMGVRTFKR